MRKKQVVSKAETELQKWLGKNETNPEMYPTLIAYWHSAGWTGTNAKNIKEISTKYAWSSAFISHILRSQYSEFPKAPSHWEYVLWAKENRKNGADKFIAYKPHEYKPVPGDIIVQRRGTFAGNLDTIYKGATTHGDIVVSNDGNKIVVIGGNVSNTAKKQSFPAKNGYLATSGHFAVIKV